MKNLFFLAVLSAAVIWVSCEDMQGGDAATAENEETADSLKTEEMIERGRYLVSFSGCHDCHTPKKMTELGPELDANRLLSGHPADQPLPPIDTSLVGPWVLFAPTLTAAVGPWGISYAANLTSHESGIGNWSKENFFTAIRKGKHKGLEDGRGILPPMPWKEIANMTDEDLEAIYVYLQSTDPVANVVPPPVPPNQIK